MLKETVCNWYFLFGAMGVRLLLVEGRGCTQTAQWYWGAKWAWKSLKSLCCLGIWKNGGFFMYAIWLIMIMPGNPPSPSPAKSEMFGKMLVLFRSTERSFMLVPWSVHLEFMCHSKGTGPLPHTHFLGLKAWLRIAAAAACWTVCFPLPCKKWWLENNF